MGRSDDFPMVFPDAAAAVAWAGNTMSRAVITSQIGRMMRGIGSDLSPEELRDYAMTILAAAMRAGPRSMTSLYLYVYGAAEPVVLHETVPLMAKFLEDIYPDAKRKTPQQLKALVVVAMIAERVRNRGARMNVSEMARIVGVSLRGFNKNGWPELRCQTMKITREWLDLADRKITDILGEKGILGG